MVWIDGKKFACAACVKGHRSSSCAHTDRELVEIGKKGRPPTQCAHCRELRRISKVHSKCMCGDRPDKRPRNPTVLPNGLSGLEGFPLLADFAVQTSSSQQAINPCSCSTGGQCLCSSPAHPSTGIRAKQKAQRKQQQSQPPLPESNLILPNNGPVNPDPVESASNSQPLPNLPSCCGAKRAPPNTQQLSTGFHPYNSPRLSASTSLLPLLAPDPIQSTSGLTLDQTYAHPNDPLPNLMPDSLFTPQTAGTALCFCGIHCPCPGCILHDPLGLKFAPNSQSSACPTSLRKAEGCLGGLDLPTINELLNLSPISDSFPISTGTRSLQLPSVSQTLNWQPVTVPPPRSCCGGGQAQEEVDLGKSGFATESCNVRF